MKKVLTLLFAVLVCACTDSEADRGILVDPIIGVWQPDRIVTVLNNGNEDSKIFTACEMNNRYTFHADGRFNMTDYPEGDDANCEELVGNLYLSGTWTRWNETVYVIELVCAIPNCDEIEEEVPDEVTFPNEMTMRIKEIDEDPDDEIDYFYYYYKRIQ